VRHVGPRTSTASGPVAGAPLAIGTGEVIYPSGRFQPFQVIGLDDATLTGATPIEGGTSPDVMRAPDGPRASPPSVSSASSLD